jgi:hypothetical protein
MPPGESLGQEPTRPLGELSPKSTMTLIKTPMRLYFVPASAAASRWFERRRARSLWQQDLPIDFEVAAHRGNPGVRLTATNGQRVLSLRNDDVPHIGHHAQVAALQMEFNLLTRTRSEMNTLEPTQRAQRRSRRAGNFK